MKYSESCVFENKNEKKKKLILNQIQINI